MKLLITGGSGFLGRRSAAHFASLGFSVLTPSHQEMDITDERAVRDFLLRERPDAVIHTAAISDTGRCQREPAWSETINVGGCVNLARACKESGSKLVICSSDQVYAGSALSGPHREEEPVSPNNIYGNQKRRAEQQCLTILPDTVCLRLSWMYSKEPFPGERGNFLSNLLEALEDESKPLAFPIHDRRGITDVEEVVKNLPAALNLPGGIYHFGSENQEDTFHLVQSVLENLGMEEALKRLTPNEAAFADHPRDISMDLSKIQSAGIFFPTTKQSLMNALRKPNVTLYICLDDRNGLQFNHRRQSRDAAVLEDMKKSLSGPLRIDPFSEKLIREAEIPHVLPPETARDCFCENIPSEALLAGCKKIVIYRWNRHYPADIAWNSDFSALGFSLTEARDFPGKSHEKITREVYER